jgi:hypothetical protein
MDVPGFDRTRAGVLHLTITNEHGELVPARVRVESGSLTLPVDASPGKESKSRIVAGDTQLLLPAGHHRLWISRGPRHELKKLDVEVVPERKTHYAFVLRELLSLPDHLCVDLHAHSSRSEDAYHGGGVASADLAAEGLDVAIATDHNAVGSFSDGLLPTLAGVEVTTWSPEIGHFNAFPVHSLPRFSGTTPARLFAQLHAQGETFVQINHPRLDDHIAFFTLGALAGRRFQRPPFSVRGADGVEVSNGYDIARPARVLAVLDEVVGLLESGHRLTLTGGSDSHGRPGHVPGYPRTCVRTRSPGDLARVLKAGDAFVTNGPLLDLRVQQKPPGSTVLANADDTLDVQLEVRVHPALSPAWVELWAGQRRVFQRGFERGAHGGMQLVVRVPRHGARTLHARVVGGEGLQPFVERGDAEPLAFTNPVYVRERPADLQAKHAGI